MVFDLVLRAELQVLDLPLVDVSLAAVPLTKAQAPVEVLVDAVAEVLAVLLAEAQALVEVEAKAEVEVGVRVRVGVIH